MKIITLFVQENTWMSHIDGDPSLMLLFGTNVIPTAFTAKKSAEEVKRFIEKAYPDALVRIGWE